MSDKPESVRNLCDLVADAVNDSPYTKKMALLKCIPVLQRYAELLEQHDALKAQAERSAGEWVPVEERLPTAKSGASFIVLVNKKAVRRRLFSHDKWYDDETYLQHGVTHWLDVKLPGEQR